MHWKGIPSSLCTIGSGILFKYLTSRNTDQSPLAWLFPVLEVYLQPWWQCRSWVQTCLRHWSIPSTCSNGGYQWFKDHRATRQRYDMQCIWLRERSSGIWNISATFVLLTPWTLNRGLLRFVYLHQCHSYTSKQRITKATTILGCLCAASELLHEQANSKRKKQAQRGVQVPLSSVLSFSPYRMSSAAFQWVWSETIPNSWNECLDQLRRFIIT